MAELIVEKYGAFVGKHSERVRVTVKGQLVEEHPFTGWSTRCGTCWCQT